MDNYNEKREYSNGVFYFNENCKKHRLDGPSLNYNNGGKAWYIDDKLHRLDGPAVEWSDGFKVWWLYDIKIDEDKHKEHKNSLLGVDINE